MELANVWPLFGLEITTPALALRPVRDADLPALVQAALDGIHEPDRMPFGVGWTDSPADVLPREFALYQWSMRNRVSESNWIVPFAILENDAIVGVQDLGAYQFADRKTVTTGSWLTRSAQGRGIGTEARRGLLLFAFDVLGALWAESSAASWNAASLAVSRKLGYVENGVTRAAPRPGEPVDEVRVRLTHSDFRRPAWHIDVTGADAALAQLGIPRR